MCPSFSEIFGTDEPEVTKKVNMPDLAFEDPVYWQHSKPATTTVKAHAQIVQKAEIDEIAGECPSSCDCGLPLEKTLNTSLILDTQLEVLAKSGKAGLCVSKEIRKSGGSIEAGLRAAYELFQEKLTPEEITLTEKAIKSLDLQVFMSIFRDGFARV